MNKTDNSESEILIRERDLKKIMRNAMIDGNDFESDEDVESHNDYRMLIIAIDENFSRLVGKILLSAYAFDYSGIRVIEFEFGELKNSVITKNQHLVTVVDDDFEVQVVGHSAWHNKPEIENVEKLI